MTRSNTSAVDPWNDLDASRPLASWYTEGVSDGVGDRLLMFDNSGNTSLELLRFRHELAAVRGFEEALVERIVQLEDFAHPAFPEIRAVEHLEGGDLALVSTFTAGKRLAEIFRSQRAKGGVHPAFGAWLVRDLTTALAELQRRGDDIAHSGLTPERIVITPDGRLMIVEHVLGAALARLQASPNKLWLDFGLLAPETGSGTACLDRRTDVIQLAWIVLSALLGRRLSLAEYPQRVEGLLDEFVRSAGPRASVLVTALRSWLERALQVKGEVFGSAMDAHDALFELRVHGGPQTIAFTARRHAAEALAHEAPRQLPPAPPSPPDTEFSPPETELPAAAESELTEASIAPSTNSEIDSMTAATDVIANLRTRSHAPDVPPIGRADARSSLRRHAGWIVAAVLALVAVVEGVMLTRLYGARAATPPPVSAPIVIDSLSPGDAVIVNGKEVGVTPITLTLAADVRSLSVEARASVPAVEPTPVQAPPAVDREANPSAATAAALAGARERRGGLRLVAPVEVQVLEGERVLGSSADGPIVTTAGRHELDFINTAVGFRSRQVVEVRAGQIVGMNVAMPDGRVSINAVPWAQVLIDGNAVGDTPLANIPLAVGEHQVTFRHPQLGEQTQRVIVKTGALTRVSATLTR